MEYACSMHESVFGLFQGKAKLDVKNSEGETALMLACHNGWIPMIELLTSSGDIARVIMLVQSVSTC